MLQKVLRNLGLSEGEIRIYSSLLNSGRSSINQIHEKTGIERRNIYDILNKLIERGLVSYITENRRRSFHISHPTRIIGYIEEKKHNLDQLKGDVEKEIPLMIQKFDLKKQKINAEIYRGDDGIKSVWENMLNHKEIHWIGSGRYVPKILPNFFINWNKRRIKLKIKMFNLMRIELKKEIKKPFMLEYIKYLPEEFSVNPITVGIYGDKVANFLLGEEFFAFVIESKELAENYRAYHKYLWVNVAKA
ncbi:MAG: helix-turn-helix domain-containing protein [Candidatus Aenigmarchaeota archaeon]|nr:helix-turn-helix domain-containing protein [Candidatus Aenigmarchaeota archaeon]